MHTKRRINTGAELVEYIIPIAVFGIVLGLGLYNFIESGTLQKFIEGSTNGQVDANGMMVIK
jgi:hypothetical protein